MWQLVVGWKLNSDQDSFASLITVGEPRPRSRQDVLDEVSGLTRKNRSFLNAPTIIGVSQSYVKQGACNRHREYFDIVYRLPKGEYTPQGAREMCRRLAADRSTSVVGDTSGTRSSGRPRSRTVRTSPNQVELGSDLFPQVIPDRDDVFYSPRGYEWAKGYLKKNPFYYAGARFSDPRISYLSEDGPFCSSALEKVIGNAYKQKYRGVTLFLSPVGTDVGVYLRIYGHYHLIGIFSDPKITADVDGELLYQGE